MYMPFKKMCLNWFFRTYLYLVCVCLSACLAFGQAPTTPTDTEQNSTFATVISTLAHQYHIGIVCEGIPIHQLLSKELAKTINTSLTDGALTNKQKVEAAAKVFDYDVQPLDDNVYVLTKRFSAPDDLPEVSLEEIESAAHNILKATEPFNPHTFVASDVLGDLLKDASPDELTQLKSGVAIGALPADKQAIARKLALLVPLGSPLDMIERVEARLRGVKKSVTYLHYFNYEDSTYPAYTGPVGSQGTLMLVVLGSIVHTDIGGMTLTFGDDKENGKKRIDPTTPDFGVSQPVSPSERKSLAELVKAWNRLPDPTDKRRIYEVVPSVARKTVSLFGDDRLTHNTILRAVEKIYGLSDVAVSDTTVRITLPTYQPLHQVSEIPDAIRRFTPPAFLRLLENQKSLDASERASRIASIQRHEVPALKSNTVSLSAQVYISSVKRLRALIEPLLEASPRKRIPMKQTSDEVHDLIAISTMAGAMPFLNSLLSLPVDMLKNIDSAAVSVETDGVNVKYSVTSSSGEGKDKKYSGFSGSTILPHRP